MAAEQRYTVASCFAESDGQSVLIGNGCVVYRWVFVDDRLWPLSIRVFDVEWIQQNEGFVPDYSTLTITQHSVQPVKAETECLSIAILLDGQPVVQMQIWPENPTILLQHIDRSSGPTDSDGKNAEHRMATGIEQTPTSSGLISQNLIAQLPIDRQHLRLTQVRLNAVSDRHNELVQSAEWLLHPNETVTLLGNLFILEDILQRQGFAFVKHDLIPAHRPDDTVDLVAMPDLSAADGTHDPHHLRYMVGLYGTSEGAWSVVPFEGHVTGSLQRFQRLFRKPTPGREGLLLSNTWGNRSRDGRITESFLLREIEAAVNLGIDVVQIDDGWQKGISANSVEKDGVWAGFWNTDAAFWTPHPERLPNGLDPIVKAAQENSIEIGLWYAPDSFDDLANWERDAATILSLHRQYAIRMFKLDSVEIESPLGLHRLHELLDKVYEQSAGRIVCELDLTAGVRPTYFNAMRPGTLFVENRYTDWRNYYPHQTLRNLWQFNHYIDPARLRMEFLDAQRNQDLYPDDPLAPACYPPEYLFAIVMFSNPLAFFEVSELGDLFTDNCHQLIAIWKAHRNHIIHGIIYPIGHTPDGTTWTGFWVDGKEHRYLLIFRELNAVDSVTFCLPTTWPDSDNIVRLAGSGTFEKLAHDRIAITVSEPQTYLLLHGYQEEV